MAVHDVEAFSFPESHEPVPELTDEVDRLREEGRHRAALETILQFLRANGRSAAAFTWALPLLRLTRTPDPSIVEPITLRQQANPYFAPIATECARCTKFWYSTHILYGFENMIVTNPLGRQCPACRFTLCRECFTPRDAHCPEPDCPGELDARALPTGRPRGMPANRHTDELEHVLMLWRDEPVSQEEADDLLDLACTWQNREGATVRSQVSQAGRRASLAEDQELGLVLVALYEREGMISEGGLHRTRVVPIESPGRGRRLVFVTAAPQTGAGSRLAGPPRYFLSDEPDPDEAKPARRRWFRRGT